MLLRIIFSVYCNYFKALYWAVEGDYFLAGECLKGKINGAYRLLESDKKLKLLGFKVMKRSFMRLFGKRFEPMKILSGGIGLIDETSTITNKGRIDFIERVLKKKVGIYLAKEELMGYPLSYLNKVLIFLSILIHGLLLVPVCIFSKNRVFHALTLYFAIESALSLFYLKKSGINTVAFSNIYSQDSNINYLIFSQHGIHVIKNPSEDALAFDNPILLTDTLIVCNPYQIEEIEIIKEIKVKSIIHGLPEQIDQYEGKYTSGLYPAERKIVGYYSSGSWLRKQQSRYYFHLNIDCALQEELLLLDLKNFIASNPEYSLKIFMHPIEKKNQQDIDLTNGYFKEVLGKVEYTLHDIHQHTCLSFEACDVAISLLSGSSLYRLIFGYKSLFYVPEKSFPTFPYNHSSFAGINIGKVSDFNLFLRTQMEMNEDEFFSVHQLSKYKYAEICSKAGKEEVLNYN